MTPQLLTALLIIIILCVAPLAIAAITTARAGQR
jgi:hypothetical protein